LPLRNETIEKKNQEEPEKRRKESESRIDRTSHETDSIVLSFQNPFNNKKIQGKLYHFPWKKAIFC
jgi:hypothetical protein